MIAACLFGRQTPASDETGVRQRAACWLRARQLNQVVNEGMDCEMESPDSTALTLWLLFLLRRNSCGPPAAACLVQSQRAAIRPDRPGTGLDAGMTLQLARAQRMKVRMFVFTAKQALTQAVWSGQISVPVRTEPDAESGCSAGCVPILNIAAVPVFPSLEPLSLHGRVVESSTCFNPSSL